MRKQDTVDIDLSELPATANLKTWGQILNVSYQTLLKLRKQGRLNGLRKPNGDLAIERETVIKCFGLEP
jgi:predicted site-specific integrase-resolvase